MTIEELYHIYLQHPVVSTDTRAITKGCLFFALKGERFDGNTYAAQAIETGASYAIIDDANFQKGDQYILVNDVLSTLQELANYHRRQLNIPFLGITGTNGKTTTKELVNAVLSSKFKTIATKGNLNNHIGVPLTILTIPTDTEIAIIEMGANHQHEIEGYCKVAMPNFAIINNCGKAHLEGFGSLEGVKKAKGELYDYIRATNGTIFINNDLDYLQTMSAGIEHRITYSQFGNANVVGKSVSENAFLKVAILNAGMETTIHTSLVGDYNLPNVLAAVAVGIHFGMNIDDIKDALEAYAPNNSRSQLIQKSNDIEIILDAYNANPTSMQLAIQNFAAIPTQKQKWVMIGGMKELGVNESQEHQAIIDLLTSLNFEHVILVGPEFEYVKQQYKWYENSTLAQDAIKDLDIKDAMILIKGSRSTKMEVLVAAF